MQEPNGRGTRDASQLYAHTDRRCSSRTWWRKETTGKEDDGVFDFDAPWRSWKLTFFFFILLPSFRVPTSATAAVSLKRTVLIFFFFVARLYFTGWRWADQRSLRDSLPLSFPSLSFSFSLDCVNGLRVFSRPSSVVSRSCATAVDPAKAGVQFFFSFSNPPPTPAPHSALVTLAPTPLRCCSESGQKKRRKKEKADGKEKRISSCQSAIALPIFWPSLPQLLSLPIFATVWTFQKLAVVGWLARLVCESSFTVSSVCVCVLVQAVHFYYTGFWIQTFLFLGGREEDKWKKKIIRGGLGVCVCV